MGDHLGDRDNRGPLAAVALPLLILGCAPGAVSIASSAFDGLSYVATGKSVSDHAISQVADQNCSTWRIFVGRAICRDYTLEEQRENELARARLAVRNPAEGKVSDPSYAGLREPSAALAQAKGAEAGAGGGPEVAAAIQPAAVQTQTTSSLTGLRPAADITAPEASLDEGVDRAVDASPLGSETMDAGQRRGFAAPKAAPARAAAAIAAGPIVANAVPAAATRDHRLYLVLASFSSRVNAEHALAMYAYAHPGIASVTVGGTRLHRVITGPFKADELAAARARMAKAYGIRFAWVLATCAGESASGCVARPPAGGTAARLASPPTAG